MALGGVHVFWNFITLVFTSIIIGKCSANDILGCGGFVKSHVNLDFSKIEIGLYTKEGTLKERTECAPTNGYYFIPVYDKGEYVLRVHPPAGWSFEPSKVDLNVDGISDACSTGQDINFAFNGFGITGRVITAGQSVGPSGVSVHLINENGETRNTVTENGGDFHFTPVIPGKYTLKATHPRWKLEPFKAEVLVKEGNTDLPAGTLVVKGYQVKGSITSFGSPISGVYVLLYSVKESPKFRVEGCQTALLQGVPDSPICHSITDNNGEFTFGLVPAGDYKLVALPKSPGQNSLVFNLKPDKVDISVKHDSLYIKQAFEVLGFTSVGSVVSADDKGVAGVRVVVAGHPVDTTDSAGKFTLRALTPGDYDVSFEHELCSVPALRLAVTSQGPQWAGPQRVGAWRVCGRVLAPPTGAPPTGAPPAGAPPPGAALPPAAVVRAVSTHYQTTIPLTGEGRWCALLPRGQYAVSVEAAADQLDGDEAAAWLGMSTVVSVRSGPVEGVELAAARGRVSGRVRPPAPGVTVRWRGGTGGTGGKGGTGGTAKLQGETTVAADGSYTFEVPPGNIEISVPTEVYCWEQTAHVVTVQALQDSTAPDFLRRGHVLRIHTDHELQVEYSSPESRGTWVVPRGVTSQCVPEAGRYTLTSLRGCHVFQPERLTVTVPANNPQPLVFRAVQHSALVRVQSPAPLSDVTLRVSGDSGDARLGPLAALTPRPGTDYHYEHTLYLADGEVAVVSAASNSAVFSPSAPQQVVGGARPPGGPPGGPPEPPCGPPALVLRARPAAIRSGRIVPPVEGVTVTLTTDEFELVMTTSSDGLYQFGPIDAALPYAVSASKPSYTFSAADAAGDIAAHKLAEIHVQLVDDRDNTPLQGGLVSVSGGSYRVTGPAAGGSWSARGLAPAQYYVKPHLQEYRFAPPSTILRVAAGDTHHLTIKGTRVAWSVFGRVTSPGGAGWPAVVVAARPATGDDHLCTLQEATTDHNGAFRVRGLVPQCVYSLHLKESADFPGLKLVKAPANIQVRDNRDIRDVRLVVIQPAAVTDVGAVVRATGRHLYRALRVTLEAGEGGAGEGAGAGAGGGGGALYSVRLDAAGLPAHHNTGVLVAPPRLPANNESYTLTLTSTLSKATHHYEDQVFHFIADGKYKYFDIEFDPKVISGEQELRQSSLLVVLLAALVGAAAYCRGALAALVRAAGTRRRHHLDRTRQ